jgi:hypothetical protein
MPSGLQVIVNSHSPLGELCSAGSTVEKLALAERPELHYIMKHWFCGGFVRTLTLEWKSKRRRIEAFCLVQCQFVEIRRPHNVDFIEASVFLDMLMP